jgi:hypothetical protein
MVTPMLNIRQISQRSQLRKTIENWLSRKYSHAEKPLMKGVKGLDELKYTIEWVFDKSNASENTRQMVLLFHERLSEKLKLTGWPFSARTNIYGIRYYCKKGKCFLWIGIRRQFMTIKFFTGNSEIEGLNKANWVTALDNNGSETYRVHEMTEIDKAVSFSVNAYRIAEEWI